MKTTVEIPDAMFRQAKARSAERGISLKQFFSEAVREHLHRMPTAALDPPWKKAFGGLRHLHKENKRIERLIEKEFEQVDREEWI